jgi:hypothetical protein
MLIFLAQENGIKTSYVRTQKRSRKAQMQSALHSLPCLFSECKCADGARCSRNRPPRASASAAADILLGMGYLVDQLFFPERDTGKAL